MSKNYICGLDIGSFKICLSCGTVDAFRKVNILASSLVPARGLSAGKIIDKTKLSACIREACRKLRQDCGVKARRVYVNIDSPDLKVKLCQKKLALNPQSKISKSQVAQLFNAAVDSGRPLNRGIIQAGLTSFKLDKQVNSVFPEGMTGREMEVSIVIVSALIPAINAFTKCIREAGLMLEGLSCSSFAQAQGLFKYFEEEPEQDYIMIDLGATLTKVALVHRGLVKDIMILTLGAESISEEIAIKLKVSSDCAEDLKINYASVIREEKQRSQEIIVKDSLSSKIIPAQQLNEVVAAKVDSLLQEIKRALPGLNYQDEKVSRVIITGGGSILEGFLERAEQVLEKPVQMGFLHAVNDCNIQSKSALYSTSVGLIHTGFQSRQQSNFFEKAKKIPLSRVFERAKRLYQEYF